MANDIGSVRGITGTSISLNTEAGQGTQKPVVSSKQDSGNTRPPCPADRPVPMPK